MSDPVRVLSSPGENAEAVPQPEPGRRGMSLAWFAWFVAGCLIALAYSANVQHTTQQRILQQSQALNGAVAEAAAVSKETNAQLARLKELDAATGELEEKLGRVSGLNGSLKGELAALDELVAGIRDSILRMDGQVQESRDLLKAIAERSQRMQTTLEETRQTSAGISLYLRRMVEIQEVITVDLSEIDRKTQWIERFQKGR